MEASRRRNIAQGTRGATNTKNFLLPFGTSGEEQRKKRTTPTNELANILFDSRTALQSANMLWQCLAEVDLLQ